jgi:probable HAF family extracellular repeat protein
MNFFISKNKIKSVMFALAATVSMSANAGIQWSITDLGTLGTGRYSGAYDINNAGQVVGWSYTTIGMGGHDPYNAFLYDPKKGMASLGTLGGSRSMAYSINDNGVVVGYSEKGFQSSGSFIYENGKMTLATQPNGERANLYAINDAGQMVGSSVLPGGTVLHAFLFSQDGTAKNLGTLGGHTVAKAISDNGKIVGYGDTSMGGWQHAFVYENNHMRDLGTLGGSRSEATSINNSGQIVGYSDLKDTSSSQAFLYEGGVMTALSSFGSYSMALDINNKGQIVGHGNTGPSQYAYFYDKGETISLSSLPGVQAAGFTRLIEARAINDNGDIVGTGITKSGAQHAFLLTAQGRVPAPATYLLLLGGLGLMGFIRRRSM